MGLIITEPGSNQPTKIAHRLVGAIDFGTQNSLIAKWVSETQKPEIIQIQARNSIKSVVQVSLDDANNPMLQVANDDLLVQGSQHSILQSVKRLMGREVKQLKQQQSYFSENIIEDEAGKLKWQVANQLYSAEQLAGVVIQKLVDAAREQHNDISQYVITVPAYFDEEQRQAVLNAAKLCGIKVLKLISEPTAAALHLLGNEKDGMYAVYDFGGGTFDFTVLLADGGTYQVITTQGDSWLGGDDMDWQILQYVKSEIAKCDQALLVKLLDQENLMLLCRKVRERLSVSSSVTIDASELGLVDETISLVITRQNLDHLVQPLIDRSLDICDAALRQVSIDKSEITAVMAIGGVCRTPILQATLAARFKQVIFTDEPEHAVVLGGAIHAAALSKQKNDQHILMDVLPISIGIETAHGIVEKIISRNTPIPITKSAEFTNWKIGQTGMVLHIVQGERPAVEHCVSLASVTLDGLESAEIGQERVKVLITVDENGLLYLDAENLRTGKQIKIAVKNSKSLSEAEIIAMLNDANKNKQQDLMAVKYQQIVAEAKLLIDDIAARGLVEYSAQVSSAAKLKSLISQLERTIEAKASATDIEKYYEQLRSYFYKAGEAPSVQSVLELNIRGKSIEEIDR